MSNERYSRFTINTSNCRSDIELIRLLIQENNWRETTGTKGKLLWFGLAIHDEEVPLLSNKIINRIPGLQLISRKRYSSELLKTMSRYFPKEFSFFPKTFTLPQELGQLEYCMNRSKNCFIIKPNSGAQGEGIYIVRQFKEVMNRRSRELDDLIVQEYIQRPLLLYRKKFDLRLYVVITKVKPFNVFLSQEGLARFCTVNYQAPTQMNINNAFMHLTNYSLNKRSEDFEHTDELREPNEGTKQTLTSCFEAISAEGHDVNTLWRRIHKVIGKTMIALYPAILNEFSIVKKSNVRKFKCFQILGVDILIDHKLKPWLLEINSNPSLRIDYEEEVSPGVTECHPSLLDRHVKSSVVGDAISVVQMKDQQDIEEFNSLRRVLPCANDYSHCSRMFMCIREVFDKLCDWKKGGMLGATNFRKLYDCLKHLKPELMRAEFDILFTSITRQKETNALDYLGFIGILEEFVKKFMPSQDMKSGLEEVVSLFESYYNIRN